MVWLEGKVAIVTGAARLRGIGRAVAMRLAEEGADVAVTAIRRPPEQFPQQEREAGWRGVESVAAEIQRLGRRALPMEVDVNLNGVYHCCKAVAAALVQRGEGGKIVNLSSLAGRQAQPQYGGYTPAKFAVIGLTQMLAKELAPHRVNVNAVCPGSTDTDMMDGTFHRTGERMGIPFEMVKQGVKQFIPLGRQAEPAEIAAVVAYLASPLADYITGQAINVDGGLVMS